MTTPGGLASFRDLCVDAHDPALVGRFWAGVLGRELELDAEGDAVLPPGVDGGPHLSVLRVPEDKTVKNRLHVDVTLHPGQEVSDLLALGATVVTAPDEHVWWVLADPEGNEFCAFPPQTVASNDADAEVPV